MMTFKPIFKDSLQFFIRNLRQIFMLCMPFLLAGAVMNFIILGPGENATFDPMHFFMSVAVSMALYPIYTGALILMMAGQADNRLPTSTDLIAASLSIYPKLLALLILRLSLVMLGLLLFILPSIWVAVRLAFCEFYLIIERIEPQAAVSKSFEATRPHFYLIFIALALVALPLLMLRLITGDVLYALKAHEGVILVVGALISFAGLFQDVVMFRIFMETGQNQPVNEPVP
jgi:hypothetical protein